ncbi:MAG TPA: DUF262 domain-containing protein, partial [Parafilimonas sp.]|nr:DUF262 domain-containing protein [Parafilimonas sp.]
MKLKESIPSNSVKIIELYNKITSEILNTRPGFQRKLVWKKQHKFHFIETILLNFPFPEVYIASAEIDIETLTAKEIVVDGQQRLTTIVDYIKGINDFANQKKIPPFEKLLNEEKKDFLNYLVTVKDLKDMNSDIIREIFQRINNTEYSLNAVEKINAEYGDGEFVIFCKQIVDPTFNPLPEDTDVIINSVIKEDLNVFFNSYNIFSDNDKSRMLDVQFIMLVVATILNQTYFSRTTALNKYLEKYNSTFSDSDEILSKLSKAVRIIKQLA